jgi:hypothetical protein
MIGLVAPPLLILAAGCALSGRLPPTALLPWLGHAVVVAIGAAAITAALAARIRAAMLAEIAGGLRIAGLLAFGLIVAPLALLYWPDAATLRLAAVSPAVGFLSLLPLSAPLTPGPLVPPWWLSPALSLAAAALLSRKSRSIGATGQRTRKLHPDGACRWVEGGFPLDQPVWSRSCAPEPDGDWRRLWRGRERLAPGPC